MAPAELKELNDQLWDLFSKRIIQSSVPPQSAPIFCEEERWIHEHVYSSLSIEPNDNEKHVSSFSY